MLTTAQSIKLACAVTLILKESPVFETLQNSREWCYDWSMGRKVVQLVITEQRIELLIGENKREEFKNDKWFTDVEKWALIGAATELGIDFDFVFSEDDND